VNVLDKLQISLAAARVNAGLTQKDVAKKLKISKNTLISWEKGNSEPKASQSYALSELYKIPLDNIFFRHSNPF
jgi:DNA-binding XRE family transcriptional regulator